MYHVLLLVAVLALLPVLAAGAQEPTGEPLLPEGADSLEFHARPELAEFERIDVQGQDFKRAIRVRTLRDTPGGERWWTIQVGQVTDAPVSEGDVLVLRFALRGPQSSDETGEARAMAYFQKAGSPWDKSITFEGTAGDEWRRFTVPFRCRDDYGAGEAMLCFGFGYKPQVAELADVSLVNHGPDVDPDIFRSDVRYEGMEDDASWRKTAAERIDRIRKADLTVIVTDSSGEPVEAAEVRVQMQRHAFGFGTAVAADMMPGGRRENEEYVRHVKELFNRVTIENALKWPRWQRDGGPDGQAVRTLRWLGGQGMRRHGHVMVWPSWRHTPNELRELSDKPEELAAAIREHIADIASRTAGLAEEWDVINEPFANHDLMDILGREVMVDWFRTARQHAPDAVLMINDYGILNTGGRLHTAHQDHYHQTIGFLLKRDAPLDAIGLQGHFGWQLTPPRRLWDILDRFAEFDLPLHVTEFDVNVSDELLQAAYMRDFLTAVFAHEAVESFTMWGFWAGRHWRPDAAIMREDFTIKPNGQAYRDLVFGQWWTDETLATDADGRAVVRGFKGDYELTVESGGRAVRRDVSLGEGGTVVKVRLD